jgi:thiamine-phosphate pyrophosphorylase
MARQPSSPRPILCAVLDGAALSRDPREFAARLFAAGVDWIQLRDRSLEAGALLTLANALVAARDASAGARGTGSASPRPRVIVNKRADVALAAGADGVHLGLDALDARSVDALAPGAWSLGVSLHGLAELEALVAAGEPIAYAHLAPIWSPRSKPAERPALGLETLRRAAVVADRAGWRLLAQGGLDAERAAAVVAAGAAGIAVTGSVSQAADPFAAVRALRRALDAQTGSGRDAAAGPGGGGAQR